MVRTYKRKTAPPSYSREDLKNAVTAVKNGQLTVYRAAKLYKIPKPTLFKHVKGQRGVKSKSLGRSTALPLENEKKIADGLKAMEKWGFGLSKREVLETIGRYVQENNIDTPFKDGVPGDDFFVQFKRTHKLSLKKPQAVEVSRKKSIDPFVIYEYFKILKEVTTDVGPTEIWNLDETSFCLEPSRVKVLGPRGMPCHRATSGPGKENITVLLAANAAGEKLPPLIVFRGKNVWDSWMSPDSAGCEGITYAATKNGWMESETFTNYFTRNFLLNIHPKRPAVLIYDGHASHIGLPLIQEARDECITILKLPSHTSHILQPLDLSVFRPMKIQWDSELVKWQRRNYGRKLPKSVFSPMIATIWKNLNPDIIKSGFEKGGIFPFSDKVVPPEKFEPEAYQRWLTFLENKNTETRASTSHEEDRIATTSTYIAQDSAEALPLNPDIDELNPTIPEIHSTIQTEPTPAPKKSFEALLLAQVKQVPSIKTGRKCICAGAEIITSAEAMERIAIKEAERKIPRKSQNQQKKKTAGIECDEDDEEPTESIEDESDDGDIFDEIQEKADDDKFMEVVDKGFETLSVNDWVIVKLSSKKTAKMYVAQISEKEPCLYVKFARRIGTSSTFHWPNVDDTSIITSEEVYQILPPPVIDKRGKIKFSVCFDSYSLS